MNTLPPPEWLILFEDGTFYGSNEGSWSEVAHLVLIDGMAVYETRELVKEVHLLFPRRIEVFKMPSPRTCFAYKRMAHCLNGDEGKEPLWLYTCFGYLDDAYRVTLVASPSDLVCSSALRSSPFTP